MTWRHGRAAWVRQNSTIAWSGVEVGRDGGIAVGAGVGQLWPPLITVGRRTRRPGTAGPRPRCGSYCPGASRGGGGQVGGNGVAVEHLLHGERRQRGVQRGLLQGRWRSVSAVAGAVYVIMGTGAGWLPASVSCCGRRRPSRGPGPCPPAAKPRNRVTDRRSSVATPCPPPLENPAA